MMKDQLLARLKEVSPAVKLIHLFSWVNLIVGHVYYGHVETPGKYFQQINEKFTAKETVAATRLKIILHFLVVHCLQEPWFYNNQILLYN